MAEAAALVTGGSRGIGAAVARALAADGYAVGVGFQDRREAAEAVVAEIAAAGGRAVALQGDVADPATPARVLAELTAAFELPVLALVNNAGIARDNLSPTLTDEEWDAVIAANLSGAFRMTRAVLKGMMRARHGRIVNMASAVALRANAGQANYSASKAGLIAFTKVVAVEVARRGITANAVAPGWIETEMTASIDPALVSAVPARRAGTPEEVAACVSFLCSEAAAYVNGAVLAVDGGLAA